MAPIFPARLAAGSSVFNALRMPAGRRAGLQTSRFTLQTRPKAVCTKRTQFSDYGRSRPWYSWARCPCHGNALRRHYKSPLLRQTNPIFGPHRLGWDLEDGDGAVVQTNPIPGGRHAGGAIARNEPNSDGPGAKREVSVNEQSQFAGQGHGRSRPCYERFSAEQSQFPGRCQV